MSSGINAAGTVGPLDIDLIKNNLDTRCFGKKIVHMTTVASTNSEAKRLIEEGVETGMLVVTETQTGGRGRLQRKWYSPPGGLWFSLVLRPGPVSKKAMPLVSLMAGVAVAEAFSDTAGLAVRLKWPNDILYQNRKLGGILTESVFSGNDLQGMIIGIGLNVLQEEKDFPKDLRSTAISLRMIINRAAISRETLLAGIIKKLESNYDLLAAGCGREIMDKWQENASTLGSRVRIELENGSFFTGIAVGLDETGALMVRDDIGEIKKVIAGDCIHLDEH